MNRNTTRIMPFVVPPNPLPHQNRMRPNQTNPPPPYARQAQQPMTSTSTISSSDVLGVFYIFLNVVFTLVGVSVSSGAVVLQVVTYQYQREHFLVPEAIQPVLQQILLGCGAIGSIFAGAGMLGLIGFRRQNKWLISYQGMLFMALALLHLSAFLVVYLCKTAILSGALFAWQGVLSTQYEGSPNSTTYLSTFIDSAQKSLHCCGLESHQDFRKMADKWIRSSDKLEVVPKSCCLRKQRSPKIDGDFSLVTENCQSNPNVDNSYIDTPCWTKVTDWLNQTGTYVTVCWISVGSVFFLVSHLAWIMALR